VALTSKAGELVVLSGDEVAIRSVLVRNLCCRIGEKRIIAFAIAEGGAAEWVKAREGGYGRPPSACSGTWPATSSVDRIADHSHSAASIVGLVPLTELNC